MKNLIFILIGLWSYGSWAIDVPTCTLDGMMPVMTSDIQANIEHELHFFGVRTQEASFKMDFLRAVPTGAYYRISIKSSKGEVISVVRTVDQSETDEIFIPSPILANAPFENLDGLVVDRCEIKFFPSFTDLKGEDFGPMTFAIRDMVGFLVLSGPPNLSHPRPEVDREFLAEPGRENVVLDACDIDHFLPYIVRETKKSLKRNLASQGVSMDLASFQISNSHTLSDRICYRVDFKSTRGTSLTISNDRWGANQNDYCVMIPESHVRSDQTDYDYMISECRTSSLWGNTIVRANGTTPVTAQTPFDGFLLYMKAQRPE